MEKYNVLNHLFYDGYDLENSLLGDVDFVKDLLEKVNQTVFAGKGKIKLISYFDGKIKRDGGVSGLILGDNFHFTCHTFSFKNTVFVDYYGNDNMKNTVEKILLDTFKTDNYDMGSKDIHGNFGKHIIFNINPISLNEAMLMVKKILIEIDMTPITDLFINNRDEENFDVLQLIAESHISFHRAGDKIVVDAFSCKDFDDKRLLELFESPSNVIEVNRGIKYIQ